MLHEAPMDALSESVCISLAHLAVSTGAVRVLTRLVRALSSQLRQESGTVGAHSPRFLDRSPPVGAVPAYQPVCTPIKEHMPEVVLSNELTYLGDSPEAAISGPLERDDPTTLNDSLGDNNKRFPELVKQRPMIRHLVVMLLAKPGLVD